MIFDRYVTADWSASNRPRTGRDSVWICSLGADGDPWAANPPTRGAAVAAVRGLLVDAIDRNERVLVGFDVPFAFPVGFSTALGLDGPPWRAVWDFLTEHVHDDPHTNENNRFEVASSINARLTRQAFWGCPSNRVADHLSMRRDQVRYRLGGESVGLSEWREVEAVLRSQGAHPHSVWKLLGAGSVGGQALTGIPVISRLRDDAELTDVSKVWPFEVTAPELPEGRPAVIYAEIWPSMCEVPVVEGQVKDEVQVIRLAEELRARDRDGSLRSLFAAASSGATEEGWILGVASDLRLSLSWPAWIRTRTN